MSDWQKVKAVCYFLLALCVTGLAIELFISFGSNPPIAP